MIPKKKLAEKVAKAYLRYNRGSSLVSFFTSMIHDVVYYGILMDLAYRYLYITIPYWIVAILVIFAVIVYYILGLIDEKIGFWKIQNSLSAKELTPFFEELDKKVDMILETTKNKRS